MGQVLFWVEAAITSVIFVALGCGILSRIHGRGLHGVVEILWGAVALLPWLIFITAFALVEFLAGGALFPLVSASVAGIAFAVSSIIVIKRGRKPSAVTTGRAAATWRLSRLALALVAALLVTCITFWNLDLAVRQEMATLRVEAGAIALSVSPPRVPGSQNAAPLYRQAWEALDAQTDTAKKWEAQVADWLSPRKDVQVGDWLSPGKGKYIGNQVRMDEFDPGNEQMLEFLHKQAPVIDLLRKAGRLPGCDFGIEYNPLSIDVVLPPMGRMRSLSQLLCLSARVAAHQGKMVEAMMDISAALALAGHISAEPPLIAATVSFACEDNVFKAFQYVLDQAELSKDSANAISLNPSLSFNEVLHRSMRMENAFGMSVFTMPHLSAVLPAFAIPGPREYVVTFAADPYRVFLWRNDLEAYLRWVRRYERWSAQPYIAHLEEWRQPEPRNGMGGLLTTLIAPSFSRSGERAARADAQHRLIMLAVAMWQYRLAEGSFPAELGQLSSKYLLTVPIDPFTGKDMKMAQVDGHPVIYSIGPDLVDDGGKPMDQQDKKGDVSLTFKH